MTLTLGQVVSVWLGESSWVVTKREERVIRILGRLSKSPKSTKIEKMRCVWCYTSTTPFWRAGPEGSKTLCNACGVRFKRRSKDNPTLSLEKIIAISKPDLGGTHNK